MDLRQLRYLVALADERHFTRAAAREHIAQPALSQQIRRLEEELGITLVERTTRQVRITDAGEVLVARGRRMLAELDAANAELLAIKGMEAGHVRVGTMHTMGPVDVSLVLAIFHERHRGIELTVREESSEELATMVRDDELDLAFLSVTERVESHGLGLHQLVLEELVVLLEPGHPLARRRRLGIGDLRDEEFISFREGARLRELLLAAAGEAGFQPDVKLESNESQRIRRLVSRGMGVAILPRSDAIAPGAEVAVVDLTDPPLARDITLAWREGRRHPPAVTEFLALAREVFSASLDAPRSPAVASQP
jgi:LysR family transcriptional regulator, transcription activator of glutamate synthase operon